MRIVSSPYYKRANSRRQSVRKKCTHQDDQFHLLFITTLLQPQLHAQAAAKLTGGGPETSSLQNLARRHVSSERVRPGNSTPPLPSPLSELSPRRNNHNCLAVRNVSFDRPWIAAPSKSRGSPGPRSPCGARSTHFDRRTTFDGLAIDSL